MIRVSIDLDSAISPTRDRRLGLIEISNDGTGTKTKGNYSVVVYNAAGRPWKHGRVEGFPRSRLGGMYLLLRALQETVGNQLAVGPSDHIETP